MVKAMINRADTLIGGVNNLDAFDLTSEQSENSDQVAVRYGAQILGTINPALMPTLRKALLDFEGHLSALPEIEALKQLNEAIKTKKAELHTLLTVIVKKRVVTGHCRYCPF